MVDVIYESKPIARKDYHCDACHFMLETLCDIIGDMKFSEKREVVKAKRNNWKIKKGDLYVRQFNKGGGDTWTYLAIPAISEICFKYDLFGG